MNESSGTLLTAVISKNAGVVSDQEMQSLWVAKITHDREIANKSPLENIRNWNLDVAKFVTENRDVIFSEDKEQREMFTEVS